MAKRNTPDVDSKPAPRRRAKTAALPRPGEVSMPAPISEASDASGPALASAGTPLASEIAQRAYEIYAEQGYGHGHDLEHWLAAEKELKGGTFRR